MKYSLCASLGVMTISRFIFTIVLMMTTVVAHAGFDTAGTGHLVVSSDKIIAPGETISTDIDVRGSIFIKNNGSVSGNISVCDNCTLTILNRGTFNSGFTLGAGATLQQLILSHDDVVGIGADVDYTVLVRSDDILSLSDILSAAGRGHVVLDNTSVILNQIGASDLELRGDVTFIVSSDLIGGEPLLTGLYGDGSATISTDIENPLMTLRTYTNGGNLYAEFVRETDYQKILNNNVGDFLNMVRQTNPNNKMLRALDGATDMDELNNIMRASAQLHPVQLMTSVRMVHKFDMLDMYAPDGIGGGGEYVINNDFRIGGAHGYIGHAATENLKLAAIIRAGHTQHNDDINEFDGNYIGGGLRINYDNQTVFMRGTMGATFARFDSDIIMSDGGIDDAPHGVSMYGAADVGLHMNSVFAPFVGITTDYATVSGDSDSSTDANIGLDVVAHGGSAALPYNWGGRIRVNTSGDVAAALRLSVTSVSDNAGGDFEIAAINNDYGVSYKIAIGVRCGF